MSLRGPTAAFLGLVAALVIAGCGGGGPDLPADAGGICETVAERFAEIQSEPPRTFADAEAQIEALVELAEAGDEALAEAGEGDPVYGRYLEARATVTELLRDGLEAVRDEDAATYGAAQGRANSGAERRRRLARQAGLEACAEATGRLAPIG